MRIAAILLLGTLVYACQPQINEVEFSAGQEPDTLKRYQDGNGYFIARGLVEQLKNGDVTKALITVNYPKFGNTSETALTPENFYLTDTLYYGMRGGVFSIEDSVERIGTEPEQITLIGQLDVLYSNGDSASYLDTISFVYINPLESEKMTGQVINGKREGKWIEYYDRDKTEVARSSNFLNGLRHGPDTVFRNSKPFIVSTWENGVIKGFSTKYSEHDGNPTERTLFKDGKPLTDYYFNSKGEISDSINYSL